MLMLLMLADAADATLHSRYFMLLRFRLPLFFFATLIFSPLTLTLRCYATRDMILL